MTLSEEIVSLQRAAHELMYLGMDGSPVYSDDLSRRNGEVYRLTTAAGQVIAIDRTPVHAQIHQLVRCTLKRNYFFGKSHKEL